jgi:hypothetical protein
MDYKHQEDLRLIAKRQVSDAEKYYTARVAAGNAELALNLILVTKINEVRKIKKNCGIEFAHLLVCADCTEATGYYKTWKENEAMCKGLERLIDARGGQLIFEQSVMKNQRSGERYG